MINSTLGGLIKDYRMQKGISQMDIAFALGWKEPSRLSRIEQGRTEKPSRELIDKIIKAIGLKEEEKNTLLLTGGYLPTEEEISRFREETTPILEKWPYPAVALDFSWRSVNHNKHAINAYKVNPEEEEMMNKSCPRVLDIVFNLKLQDTIVLKGSDGDDWRSFLKGTIFNFKYEQRHRTKEKWYIDHIKTLMQNDLFRELWVEVDRRDNAYGMVSKFTSKNIVYPKENNRSLKFYMFIVPFLRDPRFEIEYFVPSDLETYKNCH